MAGGISASDVVILVGPPFVGKTLYYTQELSSSHVRVSATEIYRSEPSANLRIVIQRIVTELRKGHKVAVDDENSQRQTRISYITGITKKVPGCNFACLQFVPQHEAPQLHLCHEWRLAQLALHNLQHLDQEQPLFYLSNVHDAASRIKSHSVAVQDVPLDWDKFEVIETVHTPLVCLSSHQFTSPILIVQWEGMVDGGSRKHRLRKGVPDAFQKWSQANITGSIVIIYDGRQMSIDEEAKEEAKKLMCSLEEQMSCHPLHFVLVEDTSGFGAAPNTGLVAWIQYLYTASLRHKSSLYVYHTKAHQLCAGEMGMRNVAASMVFSRPHTVTSVHYSDHNLSSCLQSISYLKPQGSQLASSAFESWNSSPVPRTLPLYLLATHLEKLGLGNSAHAKFNSTSGTYSFEYGTFDGTSVKCVSAYAGAGRILGMVYQDLPSLEGIQEEYQKSLVLVSAVKVEFFSASPKDDVTVTTERGAREEHQPMEIMEEGIEALCNETAGPSRFPILKPQVIQEHALNSMTYARGLEYQSSVYAIEEEESDPVGNWKLLCKCKGTSDVPYKVSATIANEGSVTESHCTCRASMSGGRCKHVVAMLLVHVKRQCSSTTSVQREEGSIPEAPTMAEGSVELPSESQSSRSLPKWIQDSSQGNASDTGANGKQEKKLRKKTDGKSSDFQLTEADLLKTALEVIEMHQNKSTHGGTPQISNTNPSSTEREPMEVNGSCLSQKVKSRRHIVEEAMLLEEQLEHSVGELESCDNIMVEPANTKSVGGPKSKRPEMEDSAYVSNSTWEQPSGSLIDELFM